MRNPPRSMQPFLFDRGINIAFNDLKTTYSKLKAQEKTRHLRTFPLWFYSQVEQPILLLCHGRKISNHVQQCQRQFTTPIYGLCSSRMETIGTKGSNHSTKNIGILPPGILTNSSWHIRNLFHAIQHVSKLWQAHLSHQICVLYCYHLVRFHAIIGQTKGPKEGKFAASSAATLGRPWRPAAASLAKNLLGRG